MASFRDKGRFSGWTGELSVKIALNQDSGLLGAAQRRGTVDGLLAPLAHQPCVTLCIKLTAGFIMP